MAIRTLKSAIRKYNQAGGYFFHKNTMKFWGSTLYPQSFKYGYFITSEDNYDRTCKKFTIRKFNEDYTDVKTVGVFQLFDNYEDAYRVMNDIIEIGERLMEGM